MGFGSTSGVAVSVHFGSAVPEEDRDPRRSGLGPLKEVSLARTLGFYVLRGSNSIVLEHEVDHPCSTHYGDHGDRDGERLDNLHR